MGSMWGEIKAGYKQNFPEALIGQQFEELSKLTSNLVIGRIEKFDTDLNTLSTPLTELASAALTNMTMRNIQDYVGENSESRALTYEVYLTSKFVPGYKYRFMLLQHGIVPYPVRAIIEKEIFDEIVVAASSFDGVYKDEAEFTDLLSAVLSSQRVMSVVNSLLEYGTNQP